MRVRGTVRALGVKIAAVAGALAISGTALAATTGHLPDAAQRRAHDVLGVPDAPPAVERVKPRPTPYLAPSSPARQPAPAGSRMAPPASATPAPTASLPELCRLWLTPPGGAHTVNATGHRALRAAAGSEKNISSYCATLLNPPTTSEAPPPGGDLPPSPAAPEPPAGDGGHTNDGGVPPATPFPEPTDAPDTPAAGSAG
jgi:hypothetical protein